MKATQALQKDKLDLDIKVLELELEKKALERRALELHSQAPPAPAKILISTRSHMQSGYQGKSV